MCPLDGPTDILKTVASVSLYKSLMGSSPQVTKIISEEEFEKCSWQFEMTIDGAKVTTMNQGSKIH